MMHGNVISSLRNLDLNKRKEQIEADKGGIVISPIRFTSNEVVNPGSNAYVTMEVTIQNTANIVRKLTDISILQSNEGVFQILESSLGNISPKESKIISFICVPGDFGLGVYRGIFCFQFNGFGIGRYARIAFGDPTLLEQLKPTEPFVRKPRNRKRTPRKNIIPGVRPESNKLAPFRMKLKGYDIAHTTENIFEKLLDTKDFLQSLSFQFTEYMHMNSGEVNMELYFKLYEGLLNIEELQLRNDLQQFDLNSVTLSKSGSNTLALTVEGLAEKRPSVVVGDIIRAHKSDDVSDKKYEGYVHFIQQNSVHLRFHDSFHRAHKNNTQRYDVEFTINRRTWRNLYQAIDLSKAPSRAPFLSKFLFPSSPAPNSDTGDVIGSLTHTMNSLALNNSNNCAATVAATADRLNAQQQSAVRNILAGCGNSAPYIIFGPPGTGKTVTIVETVKQYFGQPGNASKHILVCAPSNTAADLLVERLSASFTTRDMFRLMSFMRNKEEVSATVKKYCTNNGGGESFEVPSVSELSTYKIIVSTCMMAGKLYNHGLPEGHFDCVFVDESGHTWEAEVLSTFVSSMDRMNGQLILAGDPKQLGPITHNSAANAAGLGLSLLERLIDRPLYGRDVSVHPLTNGYNPLFITKLVNCYRCHAEIIKLPNALFYNNDLVPCASADIAGNLCLWQHLPNKVNFPLVFHGVEGECLQESTSPSWFNVSEVQQVLHYVKQLLSTSNVVASEIGIITPYQRQVKKIKKALDLSRITGCTVGSCEQLQGQERRVIIISTVRSSSDYSTYDVKYNLGFVSSPKRFNVAVTRAQALLIVIGSPKVLCSDANWRSLLMHCVDNKAYRGAPLPLNYRTIGDAAGSAVGTDGGVSGGDASGEADNVAAAAPSADEQRVLNTLNSMCVDAAAVEGEQEEFDDGGEDYEFIDRDV